VPIIVKHAVGKDLEVTLSATVPSGWKVVSGTGKFILPSEARTNLRVEIETPTLAETELKAAKKQKVVVKVETDRNLVDEVQLDVLLKAGGLPQ